jgi:hypothetical protein
MARTKQTACNTLEARLSKTASDKVPQVRPQPSGRSLIVTALDRRLREIRRYQSQPIIRKLPFAPLPGTSSLIPFLLAVLALQEAAEAYL